MISVALYQPDIPQNTAAIMRLCACFATPLVIIEPAAFRLDTQRMRRVGMDYMQKTQISRAQSWDLFRADTVERRLILFTTSGPQAHTDFAFAAGDILLFGRESAGVDAEVHDAAAARLRIPMAPGLRSLNVAMSCAIGLGEALRQLNAFPAGDC